MEEEDSPTYRSRKRKGVHLPSDDEQDGSDISSSGEEIENCCDNEDDTLCPICLGEFKDQMIGIPENCRHMFCNECLHEWSKNINNCPVDRIKFNLISIYEYKNGPLLEELYIEDKKLDLSPEEIPPTYCEICGLCDREDTLLLCDECDNGYHLDCLSPPLTTVPADEWYCIHCEPQHRQQSSTTQQNEACNGNVRASGNTNNIRDGTSNRENRPRHSRPRVATSRQRGRPSSNASSERRSKSRKKKRRKKKSTKKRQKDLFKKQLEEIRERLSMKERNTAVDLRPTLSLFGDPFALNGFDLSTDDEMDNAQNAEEEVRTTISNSPDVVGSILKEFGRLDPENVVIQKSGKLVEKVKQKEKIFHKTENREEPCTKRNMLIYDSSDSKDNDESFKPHNKSKKHVSFKTDFTREHGRCLIKKYYKPDNSEIEDEIKNMIQKQQPVPKRFDASFHTISNFKIPKKKLNGESNSQSETNIEKKKSFEVNTVDKTKIQDALNTRKQDICDEKLNLPNVQGILKQNSSLTNVQVGQSKTSENCENHISVFELNKNNSDKCKEKFRKYPRNYSIDRTLQRKVENYLLNSNTKNKKKSSVVSNNSHSYAKPNIANEIQKKVGHYVDPKLKSKLMVSHSSRSSSKLFGNNDGKTRSEKLTKKDKASRLVTSFVEKPISYASNLEDTHPKLESIIKSEHHFNNQDKSKLETAVVSSSKMFSIQPTVSLKVSSLEIASSKSHQTKTCDTQLSMKRKLTLQSYKEEKLLQELFGDPNLTEELKIYGQTSPQENITSITSDLKDSYKTMRSPNLSPNHLHNTKKNMLEYPNSSSILTSPKHHKTSNIFHLSKNKNSKISKIMTSPTNTQSELLKALNESSVRKISKSSDKASDASKLKDSLSGKHTVRKICSPAITEDGHAANMVNGLLINSSHKYFYRSPNDLCRPSEKNSSSMLNSLKPKDEKWRKGAIDDKKHSKNKALDESIINRIKSYLKPFYRMQIINKEQWKEIMKRSIKKLLKDPQVHPSKNEFFELMASLIKPYTQR